MQEYVGNRGGETTSEVYGYPEGVSGYGCYNMRGNVGWCSDVYDNGYYKGSPRKNPENTKGLLPRALAAVAGTTTVRSTSTGRTGATTTRGTASATAACVLCFPEFSSRGEQA